MRDIDLGSLVRRVFKNIKQQHEKNYPDLPFRLQDHRRIIGVKIINSLDRIYPDGYESEIGDDKNNERI